MKQADLTKLYNAARVGDVKTIEQLLPKLDPKLPKEKEWLDRSLLQSVLGDQAEAADLLLKAGANPEQEDMHNTLLTFAAGIGSLPVVRSLVEAGADYNRECEGRTALSAALSNRSAKVIKYLENLGAYCPPSKALYHACANGEVERAKRALASGADVEKLGGMIEETPLMAAVRKGHFGAAKLLLKHGANPNKVVRARTALSDAVSFGKSPGIFEALVSAGADIHHREYDKTVLMAAAEGGSLQIVKRLIELGADVHARDKNNNKTALDCARMAKHKDVADYLEGLGAISDRDEARAMIRAIAKAYGGEPKEHSQGFMLDTRFAGNVCQFHTYTGMTALVVVGLRYKHTELDLTKLPGLIFGEDSISVPMLFQLGKKVVVKSASESLGIKVRRAGGANALSEAFVGDFCRKHGGLIQQVQLSGTEQVSFASKCARFFWSGADVQRALARLLVFETLLKQISKPAWPQRRLFEREWLIKTAPRAKSPDSVVIHALGGESDKPVACPDCMAPTNLMARIDLSDLVLPKTTLGSRTLPFFWCLNCADWSPAFHDISRSSPVALDASGRAVGCQAGNEREDDIEEEHVILVSTPAGKKAGGKSKIGGSPNWIQSDQTPDCPRCLKPMAFMLQLASDERISFSDLGMLYGFVCPECKIAASLVQSH